MRKLALPSALAAALGITLTSALADSHVYNNLGFKVTVYWKAAGCAGVESTPNCGTAWSDNKVQYVCKVTELGAGKSSSYHFKDGTSSREIAVRGCTGGDKVIHSNANTGNKGNKRRCLICNDSGELKIKCGYDSTEYDQAKASNGC